MEHALTIFEKYSEQLDDMFDDGLIIEYENYDGPIYKIMYDPTVDEKELQAAIPKEWRELEMADKVRIWIKKYTTDCEEHKRAEYIVNVLLKDKRDELMCKLELLKEECGNEK